MWYVIQFDRFWVKCKSCRADFLLKDVSGDNRKNKCPNCKLDNMGCRIAKNARCRNFLYVPKIPKEKTDDKIKDKLHPDPVYVGHRDGM